MSLQLVSLLVLAPARCFLEAVVPMVVIKGRTQFPAASGELCSAGIGWVMVALWSAGDWLQKAAVLGMHFPCQCCCWTSTLMIIFIRKIIKLKAAQT